MSKKSSTKTTTKTTTKEPARIRLQSSDKVDDDIVTSDFLNCKVDQNLTKEEQRKVVQSVELTKALVLMGYQTWSALEPPNKRDKEGYVENTLHERMDEKIHGMEDFKASADFARTLNVTLQEKMMEANEERAAALFTKAKVDEMVNDLVQDETKKGPGHSGKGANDKIDKLDEQMLKEEVSQMEKAIKVLMGEYHNRKRIREKTKKAAGQVTKRVAAMMIFNKKRDTFSKIKQTQLDEIEKYQKIKADYHKQQDELEKKMEKEKELAKVQDEEKKEKKKRESVSDFNRAKLDSTNSDDGFGGGHRRNRRGRLESAFAEDDDEDVFGAGGGPNRKESVKGGPKNRNSHGSTTEDNKLDSEIPKKGKRGSKEKGPDMARAASAISGIFYWDRQQNQKSNSTFSGRSKGKLDTGKVGKKKTLKNGNSIDDYSNDLGTSLLMKPRTPMMGRKSPMLGRKSPMVDRKAIEKNKTPAMMKKEKFLDLPTGGSDSDSDDDRSIMGSGMRKSKSSLGGLSAMSGAFRKPKQVNF